jgi:hypothetical protein
VTNKYFNAEAIEQEYPRLGHTLGWRFITCPVSNADSPEALLIGLNPAGRAIHGPSWSQELGSAYVVESWGGAPEGKANLQVQVQGLVGRLGLSFEKVLSAQFVPFRSPSWAELPRQAESVAFAKKLWFEFVSSIRPRSVICIGHEVSDHLKGLFGAQRLSNRPSGWGNQNIRVGKGRDGLDFMSFPHLSRFTLFTSSKCQDALDSIFSKASADA